MASVTKPVTAAAATKQRNQNYYENDPPSESRNFLTFHIIVIEVHSLWARTLSNNTGAASKPIPAGGEVQPVVLAVEAPVDPAAVRGVPAQEPISLSPAVPVIEAVIVLLAPGPLVVFA